MSYVLSNNQVQKVTLKDLMEEAKGCYNGLWDAARNNKRDVKLYLHWTAGRYGQFWSSYHIQIDQDGSIYRNQLLDLDDVCDGTWLRNSGSISLTLLGCFDATTRSKGSNPVTGAQVEAMSQAVTVLADALDLTIDIRRVLTHGEAADNEDGWYAHEQYGPKTTCERWDLEVLWQDVSQKFDPWTPGKRGGDVIRGKANWYRNEYGVGGLAER